MDTLRPATPDDAAAAGRFYGVIAERGGTIIGSNFIDERSMIVGVGPITARPRL